MYAGHLVATLSSQQSLAITIYIWDLNRQVHKAAVCLPIKKKEPLLHKIVILGIAYKLHKFFIYLIYYIGSF